MTISRVIAKYLMLLVCSLSLLTACSGEDDDAGIDDGVVVDPVDPGGDDNGGGDDDDGNDGGGNDGGDPSVGTINGSPETGCDNPMTELSGAFLDFVDAPNVDVVLSEDGCTVALESDGKPDHTSPYWDPEGSSGLWVEAEDPDVFGNPDRDDHRGAASPGFIDDYVNVFNLVVSVDPQLATELEQTHVGALGIAVSGTPIFNRQEGPVDLGGGVIRGLDYNGAHTGPQTYHYHLEPEAISFDDESLVGIMADGFFLYGRRDYLTLDYPTDLDEHNGHIGLTQHSNGEEVYHYHITNEPYIEGSDYYLVFGAFDFAGYESPMNNN